MRDGVCATRSHALKKNERYKTVEKTVTFVFLEKSSLAGYDACPVV